MSSFTSSWPHYKANRLSKQPNLSALRPACFTQSIRASSQSTNPKYLAVRFLPGNALLWHLNVPSPMSEAWLRVTPLSWQHTSFLASTLLTKRPTKMIHRQNTIVKISEFRVRLKHAPGTQRLRRTALEVTAVHLLQPSTALLKEGTPGAIYGFCRGEKSPRGHPTPPSLPDTFQEAHSSVTSWEPLGTFAGLNHWGSDR